MKTTLISLSVGIAVGAAAIYVDHMPHKYASMIALIAMYLMEARLEIIDLKKEVRDLKYFKKPEEETRGK